MAVINGTPGDDTLTGTVAADVISGLGGNDKIDGGALRAPSGASVSPRSASPELVAARRASLGRFPKLGNRFTEI
jgi:hypothetical protein